MTYTSARNAVMQLVDAGILERAPCRNAVDGGRLTSVHRATWPFIACIPARHLCSAPQTGGLYSGTIECSHLATTLLTHAGYMLDWYRPRRPDVDKLASSCGFNRSSSGAVARQTRALKCSRAYGYLCRRRPALQFRVRTSSTVAESDAAEIRRGARGP